MCLVS